MRLFELTDPWLTAKVLKGAVSVTGDCTRALTLAVSRRLLERGAMMTFACSSRLKFFQLKSGSMYDLYSSRISLWLMAPGLV